jgi:hypothetical protein
MPQFTTYRITGNIDGKNIWRFWAFLGIGGLYFGGWSA